MISSIQNSTSTYATTRTNSTQKVEESVEQAQTSLLSSAQVDTVTISAAGAAYADQEAGSSNATLMDYLTEKTGSASGSNATLMDYLAEETDSTSSSSAASLLSFLTEETDSDSSADSSDLSNYSESELSEMVNEGQITQAEYNTELRRREAEAAAEAETSEV